MRGTWECYAFIFNFCCVGIVYGGSYALLYDRGTNGRFKRYKFNPKYPTDDLVFREIQRTFVSVLVCCGYEMCIGWSLYPQEDYNAWWSGACIAAGLVAWSDTHFYFSHRLLHEVPVLYRLIHKVHHESYNPDPWSGLSFHPIEALLYFSSLCIACVLPIPYWAFWCHKTALLIAPANGHHGHEVAVLPWLFGCEHHYLHHAHFNYNYGSPTPFWDWALGTQLKSPQANNKF